MLPYYKSRGYTDILFLALATVFGILLAGGFSIMLNTQQPANTTNITVSTAPYAMHKSLQLSTFGFTTPGCTAGSTGIYSDESSVIYAWDPPPDGAAQPGGKIKVWACDEHTITIGAGAGAKMSIASPDHANPAPVGDLNAKDCGPGTIQPCARGENPLPLYPALFLEDLTSNPNSTSADAFKNAPHPVNEVWGTWKPFPSNDYPIPNGLNVGGGDPFPAKPFPLSIPDPRGPVCDTNYGAELIWNVDQLGLAPGHSYAAVFIVHDGDNTPGADLGIGCTTINY